MPEKTGLAVAESENLFDTLFANVQPDKVCVETLSGKTLSYAELINGSGRYANALLDLGVKPGDRVAVQVDKSLEKLLLYLASLRTGAIFLPLNTAYTLNELSFFMRDAEPSLIVCREDMLEPLIPIAKRVGAKLVTLEADGSGTLVDAAARQSSQFETVKRETDDLVAILYTSGTTGRSKGAMLSHGNLASNVKALHEVWHYREDDVLLHALPIFHTHGLFVACNLTFYSGASMLFFERFNADELIQAMPRATVMMGVPTFYTRLLAHPEFTKEAARNMRVFISGSAPMTVEVHKQFEARTGMVVLERYGMTEISMQCSNPFEGERRQGTVGFPLPQTEARVADPGTGKLLRPNEIGVLEVRGPNVFKGYWRLPEKTKEEFRDDGFFITGDLATLSEDGYVTIVGRSKDLIISGGLNIYPKEVEQVLNTFKGVKESAVIGVPHPEWGETVVAVVVLETSPFNEPALMKFLKEELASYKLPRHLAFKDELPRNTMSKVQKQMLRDEFKDLFSNPSA